MPPRDHSRLVRANLEAALEVVLPSPATTAKTDYSADCGICYSYRLQRQDGAAPAAGGGGDGGAGAGEGESVNYERMRSSEFIPPTKKRYCTPCEL